MHLDPLTLRQLQYVLAETLPAGFDAFVFGSRAHGRHLKAFSDIDLCFKGPRPLTPTERQTIKDAFSESDIPYRVDILDWTDATFEFRDAIAGSLVPLSVPRPPDHTVAQS